VFTVKYGTKQMSAMSDGLRLLPWSGPLFLLAVFALSALPPSGLFRSEFEIVSGGIDSRGYPAAAVLVILVTIAFLGLVTSATSVLLSPVPAEEPPVERMPAEIAVVGSDAVGGRHGTGGLPADGAAVAVGAHGRTERILTPGEPSAWMVVPVLAGLAVLVVLGVHPPGELTSLITQAAAGLRGAP
jgi:hydrogenase-4 component F